jgi:hypothetical protein
MSRGKIAPRLWALIVASEVSALSEDWPGQTRELRALLHLDRVVRLGHLCPSRGECRICRALARVTKASAGSRGKR